MNLNEHAVVYHTLDIRGLGEAVRLNQIITVFLASKTGASSSKSILELGERSTSYTCKEPNNVSWLLSDMSDRVRLHFTVKMTGGTGR